MGGLGIYTAPVLLPLLWITANACRGAGRWYFTVLATLLASETAWAISWGLMPNLQALLPIVVAATTVVLFVKTWHKNSSVPRVALTLLALGAFGLVGIGAMGIGGETVTQEAVTTPQPSSHIRSTR
jgi:hypothetical protein